MRSKRKIKSPAPSIVYEHGKPAAVILSIQAYRDMLEQLEDNHDIKLLRQMRKRPLKFKALEDFLKE